MVTACLPTVLSPRPVMEPARSMHWPVVVIVNVNGGDHAR